MYIDIDSIAKKGMTWNVFVAARRNGKTYGILKRFMEEGIRFVYMRRTEADLKVAIKKDIFGKLNRDLHKNYYINYSEQIGIGEIYTEKSKDTPIGCAVAMSTLRKARGIEFNEFDENFYDEFIPEEAARTYSNEDYTTINAFETIFGNRELPPNCLPPMRMWLAANAIDLFNPVLSCLNLVETLVRMEKIEQTTFTDPKRSLFLYRGYDKEVAEVKKQSSLYKLIGDGEIADNILYGKFRGEYVNLVVPKVDYKLYHAMFCIDEKIYVYESKVDRTWYISTVKTDGVRIFFSKFTFDIRKNFGAIFRILSATDSIKYQKPQLVSVMYELMGL